MAKYRFTHRFKNTLRQFRRPARTKFDRGRFLPKVEPLDERVMPAVTATFVAAGGTLRVVGDELDNTIVVSRDAAGTLLVNNGAIAIQGGSATVANTRQVFINGGAGNDSIALNVNTALPAASIFGGDGNDVLIGGSGDDFFDGGHGNDMVFMGAGDDTLQWNPGDGSDVVDGQGGTDTLVFNGSDLAERFDISDSGNGLPFHRARLTRDLGNVTMDLTGIEDIDLNANGGADTITVNDQTATDIFTVNVDLGGLSFGDGAADAVIINGTAGDDFGQIASFGAFIGANVSFFPFVNITSAEAANDTLTVNTLGGNDGIDASFLSADSIGLIVNGGAGNDTLVGSQGADTFVWNPGDGSDTVDGQADFDTLVFNGSDESEKFDISANGNRVAFTRDVDNITLDLSGVEHVALNALGGADTITINDQTATDLFALEIDLNGSAGRGDGQADAVIVNGTEQDDVVEILAFDNGTGIAVGGLLPKLSITGSDGTNDRLTVNTLGGNDEVDAAGLPAGLIGLTVNLGDGQIAPRVAGVVVNGGADQRSLVTTIQVAFDQHVTLPANPADAFRLDRQGDGAPVALNAAVDDTGSGTVVTLTFTGGAVEGASLADGRYTLTVLAGQVSDLNGTLDGNADGAAGGDFVLAGNVASNKLIRLFGDVNGDAAVNGSDLTEFRAAFGTITMAALSPFDVNGDGAINGLDLTAFRNRFGVMLP